MISFLKNLISTKETFQSFLIMILTFSGSLIGIFNQKMIVENYGSHALEIYFLVLSWFILTSSFSHLGSRNTYVTLRGDDKNHFNYFFSSTIVSIISTLIFGLITYLSLYFDKAIDSNYLSIYIIPYFFFQTFNTVIGFYLVSIKKPLHAIAIPFFSIPLSFVLLYFKVYDDLFFTFFISLLISFIFLVFTLFKILDLSIIQFHPKSLMKYFLVNLPISSRYIFSEFTDVFTNRVSVFFLAYYANDLSEMAEFSIAFALLKVSMMGIDSMATVFSPEIFDALKESKNKLRSTFFKVRNLFIIVSLASFIIIFFVSETVISYFFSDQYLNAYKVLLILQIGQIIHSCFGPNTLLARLYGLPITIGFYKLITTLIMIIINFIFYNQFGIYVLAFSYSFSLLLWNIATRYKIRNLLY